jgi:hypothetical protein
MPAISRVGRADKLGVGAAVGVGDEIGVTVGSGDAVATASGDDDGA